MRWNSNSTNRWALIYQREQPNNIQEKKEKNKKKKQIVAITIALIVAFMLQLCLDFDKNLPLMM